MERRNILTLIEERARVTRAAALLEAFDLELVDADAFQSIADVDHTDREVLWYRRCHTFT